MVISLDIMGCVFEMSMGTMMNIDMNDDGKPTNMVVQWGYEGIQVGKIIVPKVVTIRHFLLLRKLMN